MCDFDKCRCIDPMIREVIKISLGMAEEGTRKKLVKGKCDPDGCRWINSFVKEVIEYSLGRE